jgi:tripartite-type tricarboxylate transporter receptor subunit TctC
MLQRHGHLPDVPTLAEAGLPHQEADTILGILVPAGTPQPIIALLYREIGSAIRQPDVAEKLAVLGFESIVNTPEEFAARIDVDIPKWANVIRTANIKAD